ncbi:MAG: glucose-1-phosphate adenylyltransferase [Clostridia bacterium]|nr:glucose-1-phosphate adenylyltransferase [Clostridia bacterium]
MIQKKKCIAMLLAGGQGSRLKVLTKNVAKPAVPFGAKFRIIDFPLSNCINSDITVVGVLTQYQPLVLNRYIRTGDPWDLDRLYGGVYVLPPYQQNSGADWYKGTANAIYQNFPFIEQYDPEHVLILSGDHIYTMDYSKMLEAHERANADATVAVIDVPWEEASRFGILATDDEGRITEFQEKPPQPKSNQASMGIYIFKWSKLKEYLERDEEDPASSNDFGKNIIPAMLNDGQNLFAYSFHGYWKDVGTIDSLWEANMDLIFHPDQLKIDNPEWKIYARNPVSPPHYTGPKASIENSIVSEGGTLCGRVKDSVVSYKVDLEEGAEVFSSVVMQHARIEKGAKVYNAIIGEGAVIGAGAVVGAPAESGNPPAITVVGPSCTVLENETVPTGAIIDREYGKKEGSNNG